VSPPGPPAWPTGACPGGPLCGLEALEAGYLVHNAVCELALGGLVAPVVKRLQTTPAQRELLAQDVNIGGLSGEAVSVLGYHHRHAGGGHQVSHAVHARTLQAYTALAGVLHLLEDLEPLSGGVFPQSL
jgi:hypothetical protein